MGKKCARSVLGLRALNSHDFKSIKTNNIIQKSETNAFQTHTLFIRYINALQQEPTEVPHCG